MTNLIIRKINSKMFSYINYTWINDPQLPKHAKRFFLKRFNMCLLSDAFWPSFVNENNQPTINLARKFTQAQHEATILLGHKNHFFIFLIIKCNVKSTSLL